MKRHGPRRLSCLAFAQGKSDAKAGRIVVDKDGTCNSPYLEACTASANAAISYLQMEYDARISDLDNKKKIMNHRLKYLLLRKRPGENAEQWQDERKNHQIGKLKHEIIVLNNERIKLIKQCCGETEAMRYLFQAREVQPYLNGASGMYPGARYTIQIQDQAYYYHYVEIAKEEGAEESVS